MTSTIIIIAYFQRSETSSRSCNNTETLYDSVPSQTVGGDDYNSVCCSTDLCNMSPAAPRRPAGAAAVVWWSAAMAAVVFASVAPSLASA